MSTVAPESESRSAEKTDAPVISDQEYVVMLQSMYVDTSKLHAECATTINNLKALLTLAKDDPSALQSVFDLASIQELLDKYKGTIKPLSYKPHKGLPNLAIEANWSGWWPPCLTNNKYFVCHGQMGYNKTKCCPLCGPSGCCGPDGCCGPAGVCTPGFKACCGPKGCCGMCMIQCGMCLVSSCPCFKACTGCPCWKLCKCFPCCKVELCCAKPPKKKKKPCCGNEKCCDICCGPTGCCNGMCGRTDSMVTVKGCTCMGIHCTCFCCPNVFCACCDFEKIYHIEAADNLPVICKHDTLPKPKRMTR